MRKIPSLTRMARNTLVGLALCLSGQANAMSVPGSPNNNSANPPEIVEVSLELLNSNNTKCPVNVVLKGSISTSRTGNVQYFIVQKGGAISGPHLVRSTADASGKRKSVFERQITISRSISTQYKLLAIGRNGKTESQWAPLQINCH